MKGKYERSKGRTKWNDDSKVSWAEAIPPELWDELFEKLNWGSEYPKGTITAARHVTYSQHFNRLAEMIRLSKKSVFRTDTEIFRVAIHQGMGLLYNVFCNSKNSTKNTRSHFFYEAIKDLEKKMEQATMVSVLNEKISELSVMIKKHAMSREQANAEIDKLFMKLPEDDKEHVVAFFKNPNSDNVRNINEDLINNFVMFK